MRKVYYSNISLYETCPKEFDYKYISKVSIIDQISEMRDFGRFTHNIIANYFKNFGTEVSEEKIVNRLENLYDKKEGSFFGHNKTKFRKVITNFKKFEVNRLNKFGSENYLPTHIEKHFSGKIKIGTDDEVDVGTVVDIVFPNGIIIDWKLGKNVQVSAIQSGLMREILPQNGIDVNEILFVFLLKNKAIRSKTSDVNNMMSSLRNFIYKLRREKFPKKISPLCRYCAFEIICNIKKNYFETGVNWYDMLKINYRRI